MQHSNSTKSTNYFLPSRFGAEFSRDCVAGGPAISVDGLINGGPPTGGGPKGGLAGGWSGAEGWVAGGGADPGRDSFLEGV